MGRAGESGRKCHACSSKPLSTKTIQQSTKTRHTCTNFDAAQVHGVVQSAQSAVGTTRQPLKSVAMPPKEPPAAAVHAGAVAAMTAAELAAEAAQAARGQCRHAFKVDLGMAAIEQALAGAQRWHQDGQLAGHRCRVGGR